MYPLYLIVRGKKILRKCMETELHQLAFVALTVPQTASKEHHSLKEMQQISLNTQQKYSQRHYSLLSTKICGMSHIFRPEIRNFP